MLKNILAKFKEAFISVLPIAVLIVATALLTGNVDYGTVALFAVSAIILIVGMAIFTLGADMAMIPIGSSIGSHLSKNTKSKRIWVVLLVGLLLGILVTIAEPDLQVLAEQLQRGEGKNVALLLVVAVGVGAFLIMALLRIFFKIKLKYIIVVAYTIVFVLAAFVPKNFLTIAFDSGGVTTGPITVPFLMAFGIGIAGVRGGETNRNDSFGMIALCSIGPVLAVLIFGLTGLTDVQISEETVPVINSVGDLFRTLGSGFPKVLLDVLIAIIPIVAVFALFQIFCLKLPKVQVIRISVGLIYTYIGLSVFLTAVSVGFLPMGKVLGEALSKVWNGYVLIPFGVAVGLLIVLAEPSVHILTRQVEQLTGGAISKGKMFLFLSVAISLSVGLAMLRVVTGISVWYFLLPCYAISIILTFFVPEIFTAVAFDSGGVASGAMTSTFLLPLAVGACEALGGNVFEDAYGLVAFVAMTPLVTLQIMGLIYTIKKKHAEKLARSRIAEQEMAIVFDTPVEFVKKNVDETDDVKAEETSTEIVENNVIEESDSEELNSEETEEKEESDITEEKVEDLTPVYHEEMKFEEIKFDHIEEKESENDAESVSDSVSSDVDNEASIGESPKEDSENV